MGPDEQPLKIDRHGDAGGYHVSGYYITGKSCWQIRVWPADRDEAENRYDVTDGKFDSDTATPQEREAVLKLISKWEAEKSQST